MDHFLKLELDSKLIKTLKSIGFTKPTPIQEVAIPKAIDGLDLFASAQTGTGKTGAFLLPILHRIAKNPAKISRLPRVLILVPTRELAEQVSKEAIRFSKHLSHAKTVCVYGGMPYHLQNKALSKPFQILVSTPGRLLDHMERGRIDLSEIEYLVLDEADRMVDMGFIRDVEKIAAKTPKNRQTLLFSATLNKHVQKVSNNLQNNPYRIAIEPDVSDSRLIDKRLYYVDDIRHKMRLLDRVLEDPAIHQAIVFTSTKVQADKLTSALKDRGIRSEALHGDMNQSRRNRTMKSLRLGKIQILVATDVASRGLDVMTLSHVINFDIPHQAEDFIHRIGRTGRAGSGGVAITFATYPEKKIIVEIDKLLGAAMDIHTITGLEPKPESKQQKNLPPSRGRNRRFGFAKAKKEPGSFQKNKRRSSGKSNRSATFPAAKGAKKKKNTRSFFANK